MGWREKEAAKLAGKRVLMVGAGGIGCELLKNLVLSGFHDIHVIDLDTIDVSNLNRQFLFRREHVGRAKADVATEAAIKLAPASGVNITFDHDSIFSEKFDYDFFKQFFVVLNALDNRSARNHVNRMCMSTRIPLIDGGSAGYFGQVSSMVRGRTECYECEPKPENVRSFPGCTIRNTPSEHIHCTVWAKHVFNQLFGELDIDDDVSPDLDDENAKGEENGEAEKANGSEEKKPESIRSLAEASSYDPIRIFNKLFVDDIDYLLRMQNLWKERRPPVPSPFETLARENAGSSNADESAAKLDPAQKVWTPAENGEQFKVAVEALSTRKREATDGLLCWDKDDDDAMRFVAATANIRAGIFGIATKSLFEIKSMAGNIIPAIATTNAIIAGVMTMEALKLISGDISSLRSLIIWPQPTVRGKILSDDVPPKPNPKCYTCAPKREVTIRVNLEKMTIQELRDVVLIAGLGIASPDVMDAANSRVIISSDEGETDGLMQQTLTALGVSTGSRLLVDDFDAESELTLCLLSANALHAHEYTVVSDVPAEKEEDGEAMEEGEGQEGERQAERKRKSHVFPDEETDIKRARIEEDTTVPA